MLHKAYNEQNQMLCREQKCWLQGVYLILKQYGMINFFEQPGFFDESYLKDKMKDKYIDHWKSKLWNDKRTTGGNKLRTYREFKSNFVYEEYLNCVTITEHRNKFTQFRISAHQLNIETGRYKRPPLPVEARVCKMCDGGYVEDEFHIFQCDFYKEIRQEFNVYVLNRSEFIEKVSNNNYCKLIAMYIFKCLKKRDKTSFSI